MTANQPENNNPPNIIMPTPNEWAISEEMLSTLVDNTSTVSTEIVGDDKIKWFQMVASGGETETEKKETIEAQKEQLRLGILKMQAPTPQIQQQAPIPTPISQQKIQGTLIPQDILNGPSKPVQIQQQKKVKIGPNDPCFCGSGRKHKKCCQFKQFLK